MRRDAAECSGGIVDVVEYLCEQTSIELRQGSS